MKHEQTIDVPATTKVIVLKVTCDICNSVIKTTGYNVDEVTIEHKSGKCYPEDGYYKITHVDLCGKCFQDKLIPWLKDQGAKPSIDEIEY